MVIILILVSTFQSNIVFSSHVICMCLGSYFIVSVSVLWFSQAKTCFSFNHEKNNRKKKRNRLRTTAEKLCHISSTSTLSNDRYRGHLASLPLCSSLLFVSTGVYIWMIMARFFVYLQSFYHQSFFLYWFFMPLKGWLPALFFFVSLNFWGANIANDCIYYIEKKGALDNDGI